MSTTRLIDGPAGPLEYLCTGSGRPVTLFAHGLAGSIPEVRAFAAGVTGSRCFLHFRGHGRSAAPPPPWSYDDLAGELRTVADHVSATRALGVSMGAGALMRLLADGPTRFEKIVLVLPASIDRPRVDESVVRLDRTAALVDAGDVAGVAELLRAEQPKAVRDRPDVVVWTRRRAERLVRTPVSLALRSLPGQSPLTDRAAIAAVDVPALVLGQEGDTTHPAEVARELGGLLPQAHVVVFPEGGLLWTHRQRVRELISAFLRG